MNRRKRRNHPRSRLRRWIGAGILVLLGVDPVLRIPEGMAQIAPSDPADPAAIRSRSPDPANTDTANTDTANTGFDGVRAEGERLAAEGWIGRLNLTPRQFRRIQMIRRSRRPQLLQAQRELRQARRALGILMAQDDASTDSIREQHTAVRALDDQVRELRFEILLRIREVLTPAQRQELGIILEERSARY